MGHRAQQQNIMRYHFALLVSLWFLCRAEAIYKAKGNPYEDGPLTGTIKETYLEATNTDGLESDTLILYPDKEDVFGVFFFIGGWEGLVPATIYHTLLTKVAAHGFIVVGPWPLSSDEPEDRDVVYTALLWARENVHRYTGKAKPDFEYLAVGAHSAGANSLLRTLNANKTTALAFIGLEAFSTDLEKEVEFSVPGLFLGTQLSEYSCSIPGVDYENFYNNWKCPRVMVEVKGIGHCGILEDAAWTVCDTTQRCRTGDPALLPSYKQFTQGYVSAFLMVHVQNNPAQYKYVTDRSLMPFELTKMKTDVSC